MKISKIKPIKVYQKGWLETRFGDHYAQISADIKLRLRSSVKDVARVMLGRVPPDIEALAKKFAGDPQIPDSDFIFGYEAPGGWEVGSIEWDKALQEYIAKYPDHWETVQKTLALTRSKTRHPSAWVIANKPIGEFIPMTTVSDVKCTSYIMGAVEAAGGIKNDYLTVSSLNDISECIQLIQSRAGIKFPDNLKINDKRVPRARMVWHGGKVHDIWDLPDDQNVFGDIAEGNTETVFQFHTDAAKKWLKYYNKTKANGNKVIDSIKEMAIFTALDRPGPLDVKIESPEGGTHNALQEYVRRSTGQQWADTPKILTEILPDTLGLLIFQEGLTEVYRQLTGCTGAEAETFRGYISKKNKPKLMQLYPMYLEKAGAKVGLEEAKTLYKYLDSWSSYGFGFSHAICYAVTAYACAYLKYHYPLEWWTAVLRNATKNEISFDFWRYCGHMINLPDIKKSHSNFEIVGQRIQAPLSLLQGIGEAVHNQIQMYQPYEDIQDFCNKINKFQEAGATVSIKIKKTKKKRKDKETGLKVETVEEKEVETKKLGHNSINRKAVYTLIISGAMDSLFPDGSDTGTMLEMYEQALANATGDKLTPVKAEFTNVDSLHRYQIRKSILPAYSVKLTELVEPFHQFGITRDPNGQYSYSYYRDKAKTRKEFCRVLSFKDMEEVNASPVLPDGGVRAAVVGYIEDGKRWSYGGGKKEAFKAIFDIDGGRIEMIRWGDRDGFLDPIFTEKNLVGAIIIAKIVKYAEGKPFGIDSIEIVRPPLETKKKE